MTSLSPVFVVGCQRSGSTLLGSLLGGHPEIVCIPEAQFVADLIPPNQDALDSHALIDRIEKHWRYQIWNYDLRGRRPDTRSLNYADTIRWLVSTYGKDFNRSNPRFWVDHQPGHAHALHRLSQQFPDLKVIHIVRDGRAVAASLLPLDWGPNEIHSAAYFWEQRLAWSYSAGYYLGPERFITVRYEDIVSSPEESLKKIAEFLGLPFHPDMVLGTGLNVPDFTKNQHALVGSMPDPKRINSWQKKLTARQIEIFEAIAGDVLPCHGYELVYGLHPRALSYLEKIHLTFSDQFKALRNRMAFSFRQNRFVKS